MTETRDRPAVTAPAERELLSLVDRRSPEAPWTCLFRTFFEDSSRLPRTVRDELAAMWGKLRVFDGAGEVFTTVIRDFAVGKTVPDSTEFRRWLRLCGLNFEAIEGDACRRLLAGVAPRQGRDLLHVVELHLRRTDVNPSYDLPIVIEGLKVLAHDGQPIEWRIDETTALPDYDADLRLGAIFYLCRFVNSPTRAVARQAAKALSHSADIGVRAVDENLRPRWLQACRSAFGSTPDEGQPSAQFLAVWNGDPDDPPRYALENTIDRGDCRLRRNHPVWYCGAAAWNGHDPAKLVDFFVETRELEWDDAQRVRTHH